MLTGGKEGSFLRFLLSMRSHLDLLPAANHFDFRSEQNNPMIHVNQNLSRRGKLKV